MSVCSNFLLLSTRPFVPCTLTFCSVYEKSLCNFEFLQLPFQLVMRVWDAMFFQGESVLAAMSLVILKINTSESGVGTDLS